MPLFADFPPHSLGTPVAGRVSLKEMRHEFEIQYLASVQPVLFFTYWL